MPIWSFLKGSLFILTCWSIYESAKCLSTNRLRPAAIRPTVFRATAFRPTAWLPATQILAEWWNCLTAFRPNNSRTNVMELSVIVHLSTSQKFLLSSCFLLICSSNKISMRVRTKMIWCYQKKTDKDFFISIKINQTRWIQKTTAEAQKSFNGARLMDFNGQAEGTIWLTRAETVLNYNGQSKDTGKWLDLKQRWKMKIGLDDITTPAQF